MKGTTAVKAVFAIDRCGVILRVVAELYSDSASRVFLRKSGCLFYSRKAPGWSGAKEDAAEFESIGHAIRFAVETSLEDADLYIAYADPADDFVIPLQKHGPHGSPGTQPR